MKSTLFILVIYSSSFILFSILHFHGVDFFRAEKKGHTLFFLGLLCIRQLPSRNLLPTGAMPQLDLKVGFKIWDESFPVKVSLARNPLEATRCSWRWPGRAAAKGETDFFWGKMCVS